MMGPRDDAFVCVGTAPPPHKQRDSLVLTVSRFVIVK